MGEIIHHPEAGKIADALYAIADRVPVKSAHWITLPDGSSFYTNHGAEWCRDCGRAMLRRLRKLDRKRREDYMLDGGWACEHETPPHCCGCGSKLEAILTGYGALEELAHFRDNPPRATSAEQVYEVREMLIALEYTDEEKAPFALEAIEIGRALTAKIAV